MSDEELLRAIIKLRYSTIPNYEAEQYVLHRISDMKSVTDLALYVLIAENTEMLSLDHEWMNEVTKTMDRVVGEFGLKNVVLNNS